MKSYICDNCGHIEKIENFNENTICSNCKSPSNKLRLIENEIAENEIDAIINSVIEDITEEKEEKIINKNEEFKYLEIQENNPCVKRIEEKCINCGQCKKTCEKFANLKYNLNEQLDPICIGCGECIKNCPTKALVAKEDYIEVKDIIDKNEKIVVAIVEPNIPLLLKNHYKLEIDDLDNKINDILKQIGFDYIFNSGFACDINIIEKVSEFIERLKNRETLPFIISDNYSLKKYLKIYHSEVINYISTCKSPLLMQSEIIKDNFCTEKGFSKEKIITVGITSNISNKMKIKEDNSNLDYVITVNELIKIIEREEINLSNLVSKEYDGFNEFSSSSKILDLPGGQAETFVKTFCRLVNKTKKSVNEIDESIFMNVNGLKEVNLNIGSYELRIAIINSIYELDYIISSGKYKNYHFIEINMYNNGFLEGNGFDIKNIDEIKEIIYKSVKNYPIDNKSVQTFYKSVLSKPLSQKSIEILHE